MLNKLYATRDYNPIFVTSENQTRMSALLNALEGSNYHGIPSELYGLKKLYSDIDDLRSELKLGALEIEFAKKFILYVKHMKLGVLDPKEINMRLIERESLETEKKISTQLDLKLRKINFIEIFTEFMITNPFKYLEQLQPQADDYKTLLKEKILLEKTLTLGGWGETVTADILRSGESGGEVTKLRNRLIRMGYLKKTYSPVYDSGLKSAVKKFQGAHGLKSDGIAGKITIAEINIPSSERLKLIVASLERRRWLNKPYDGKYVVVNIPEFKLRIVKSMDELLNRDFDISILGSVIQYMPNFLTDFEDMHYLHNDKIFISHTPLSLKGEIQSKQLNAPENLRGQTLHDYFELSKLFNKLGYCQSFKSTIDPSESDVNKKYLEHTVYANILFNQN